MTFNQITPPTNLFSAINRLVIESFWIPFKDLSQISKKKLILLFFLVVLCANSGYFEQLLRGLGVQQHPVLVLDHIHPGNGQFIFELGQNNTQQLNYINVKNK